jgi:hypothetical protein
MFNETQLKVVAFCADECVRQKTGPEAVAWMVNAYQYAATTLHAIRQGGGQLEMEHILTLVTMIEPDVNRNGFRQTSVGFGIGFIATVLDNQQTIPSQVKRLLGVQDTITPEEFYQEYEEIHPCADGNGRAGAILFNLLKGTLDNPEVPPPFNKVRMGYRSSFGEVEEG